VNDDVRPAAPTPTDAERRLLAGDVAAAAAIVAATPETDDPSWARLRVALALLSDGGAPGQADLLRIRPQAGRPPPDLPALASALRDDAAWRRLVDGERRLALSAAAVAQALLQEGKAAEACDLLEQILAGLAPTSVLFRLFGRANAGLRRVTEAVFAYERALDLAPGDRGAMIDLAMAYLLAAQPEDAAALLATADPDPAREPQAHSCLLQAMADTSDDGPAMRAARLRYRQAAAARTAPAAGRGGPAAIPVIGFLWPAQARAARYLMADLLRHRDPTRWRARLYADGAPSDLAPLVDQSVSVAGQPPDAIARRIRDDGVDLLVSFAGHAHPRLLGVLDHRPARLHAEWPDQGWPSGHPAVTHLFTAPGDGAWLPDLQAIELPAGGMAAGVPLARADALGRVMPDAGPFAFGWCGPAARVTARAIAAWARILGGAGDAVLHLRHDQWRASQASQRLVRAFARHGIDRQRLVIAPPDAPDHGVGRWQSIHLALDSFPAGDVAATLDALAMGVPVVAIAGSTPAGRHAAAVLGLLGLQRLVAADEDEYVEKALALAATPDALRELRTRIPRMMRESPLGGGPALARTFEAAIDPLLDIQRGA
jgi:predicted O-linked N-acetylglucosamine transferase (SPINDLY family)